MPCTHGQGARLDVNVEVDGKALERLDAAVAGPGDDPAAVRLGLLNHFLGPGRFGRMFDNLPKFRPPDENLDELAAAMRDEAPQDAAGDSDIPAGITYLGQFIDHDITRDKTEGFLVIEDALGLVARDVVVDELPQVGDPRGDVRVAGGVLRRLVAHRGG